MFKGVVMKVQAINSAMSSVFAQPVGRVEFSKQHSSYFKTNPRAEQNINSDMFVMEQKYDLACRLAAYWKTQYDELKENGCCMA